MPTYTQHTAHFNKAKKYTYNYKIIDDAISEAYNQGYTAQQIANSLREPVGRIQYRVKLH
jgi:alkyl sulfatase BDS1-like metallo-beta-lactamase superfamily hydrolase